MKKQLNIAIIGFGGMGEWHCHQMKASKIMNVVGVYDISEERQKRAAELGLKVFESPVAVAVEEGLDAVLIATPNDLHLPYTEYFAARGKHIICEKPAALTSGYFEMMTDAAKAGGVLLIVHQNRRWDPDFLTVKQLKAEGTIGEIYDIESCVTGSHGIPGDWRKVKEKGGGMLMDWGIHLIDQMLQFDSSPVVEVDCDMSYIEGFEVDDGFTLRLRFQSGLRATLIVDTNCFINRPRWRIQGTDGTAVIENWAREGKIVRVKEREDKYLRGIDAGNGFTRTMADRSAVTVEELPLPEPMPETFAFYKNVLAAVNGGELAVKPEEVSRALKVMGFATLGRLPCRI